MPETVLEEVRELVGTARRALSDALHLCTRDLADEPLVTEAIHRAYSAVWDAKNMLERGESEAA